MNKLQSLVNLQSWDFNVPHFVLWTRAWDVSTIKREYKDARLAVRSCRPGQTDFGCPFEYDISAERAFEFCTELKLKGYEVILYKYIPKEWSVVSGHISFCPDLSGFYEVYYGEGVVRDIMRMNEKGMVIKHFNQPSRIREQKMREIVREASDIVLFEQKNLVVEFSYGDRPAGIKDERLVFWEYRYAG